MRENKTWKIIKKVSNALITIIVIGFVIVVCMQRISNNKLSFFNFRMFTVVTGSMEPKYNVGDVLISKKVKPSEIKIGDAISYEGIRGDVKGKVITHEVIGYSKDENGKYLFKAKGLKNIVQDPIVSEDQIFGVIVYKIFTLSILAKIIQTNIGFYLLIIIPLMYVIISEVINLMLSREEKRRSKI